MARGFSTSARVHPSFLPHLQHPTRRLPSACIKTVVAFSAVGYGTKTYLDYSRNRVTPGAAPSAAEHEDAERQRRDAMIMEMYGDRSSLEDLEKAVAMYERK